MTRRCLFLGAGVLAVSGVALWLASPPSGIGRLSCLRIRAGMSREQVETVLGCPPGDYRAEPCAICESWLHAPGHTRQDWYGDDGDVRVVFDAQRRVVASQWRPRHESAIDAMVQWISGFTY